MKRIKLSLVVATGLMTGLVASAATPSPDSFATVEAASLVRSPQNSWARAILFSDVLVSRPGGRVKRLDRKNYLSMKLEEAGTVWVPEALAMKFQQLEPGRTYSFAGTVDQISRRYYVIVDACYVIQTAENMDDQWTDMLNPAPETEVNPEAGLSATGMQALLQEAQNSLIQMAAESNMTVAQLIEAQSDGGQRIAENIVAKAVQGELRAQKKTADELMIASVLALLQKQAVLSESEKIADANEALKTAAGESPPLPETVPEAAGPDPAPEQVLPISEPAAEGEIAAPAEEILPAPGTGEASPKAEEVAIEEGPSAPEGESEEAAPVVDETGVVPKEEVAVSEALPEESPPTVKDQGAEQIEAGATEDAALPDEVKPEEIAVAEEIAPVPEESPGGPEGLPEETPPVVEPAVDEGAAAAQKETGIAVDVTPPEAVPGGGMENPAVPEGPQADLAGLLAPADRTIEFLPGPTVEEDLEAVRATELISPAGASDGSAPVAAPPSSMLVVPMSESQPAMVPLVSVEPTKAELARMKKQAALEERERIRAEKKAAAAEAKARKIAEKQARAEAKAKKAAEKKAAAKARAEAKRVAAAEKKAATEARVEAKRQEAARQKEAAAARAAELARKKAEEKAARKDAALKKAAEAKARKEAQLAEAATRKAQAKEARRLALEEQQALEAVAQAERLSQQADEARRLREEADARLAEVEARVAAEKAQMAESVRIAKEVAAHEQKLAEEAAATIQVEEAARKAAEEKIRALEAESRSMAAATRRAEKQVAKVTPAEEQKRETAAKKKAEKEKKKAAREKARKEAARKKAEKEAARKKAVESATKEKAAAGEAEARKKPVPSGDTGELPEWMQPVLF